MAGGALKVGVDFPVDHEISGNGTSVSADVDTSASFSAELFGSPHKNIDIGGGMIFQLPRKAKLYGAEGKFNFIPFYGLVRLKSSSSHVAPYGIVQIGYNLFLADTNYKGDADLRGGLYYGVGGGVIIKKMFSIELLYSENNGEAEYAGYTLDVKNTQFTLNFGFNF